MKPVVVPVCRCVGAGAGRTGSIRPMRPIRPKPHSPRAPSRPNLKRLRKTLPAPNKGLPSEDARDLWHTEIARLLGIMKPRVLQMDRRTLLKHLRLLNVELKAEGVTGEICVVGGAAMILAFRSRSSTRDIDALLAPAAAVRRAAAKVAEALSLPENWLNDSAKGFLADKKAIEKHELLSLSHLRVVHPQAQYILAMKCIAARVGLDEHDKQDAKFLIGYLGLVTPEQIMQVVGEYYSKERIPPKTQYFIGEICHELFPSRSDPG